MATTGRRIMILATLVALAVAAIVVYAYTARSTGVSMASGAGKPVLGVEQAKSVLLTEAEHPAGTVLNEMPIAEANKASTANRDASVRVSPESCLNALQIALGGAEVTGWMQTGTRPSGAGRSPFQNAVGRVDSGLDVNRLREVVGTCKSGTITWTDLKVTSTISLAEVAAPEVKGTSTFAYQVTMQFNDITAEELAAVQACEIEVDPGTGSFQSVSQSCLTDKAVAEKRTDVTVTQYIGYAASYQLYVEACAASMAEVQELLAVPVDRLRVGGYLAG